MPKIVNNPIDDSNIISERRSSRASRKRQCYPLRDVIFHRLAQIYYKNEDDETTGVRACLSDSDFTNETFLEKVNDRRTAYIDLRKMRSYKDEM